MSLLGWVAKIFGYGPASLALDEASREARDFMAALQDDGNPVPLSSADVRRQQDMIASAAHAYPPTCPPSETPSAPVDYTPVSLPVTPRPLPPRPSSGPPPRMSPPPPLPAPALPRTGPGRLPPPPVFPRPPRPMRKR